MINSVKKKSWLKPILLILVIPLLLSITGNIMTPEVKELASSSVPLWVVVIIIIIPSLIAYFYHAYRNLPKSPAKNSVQSLGEMLCLLQKGLENSTVEVWICLIDKSWFFTLIPSIAMCRSRGIAVTAFVESSNLRRRYRLLKLLGGQVIPVEVSNGHYFFSGVVIDPHDSHHGTAIALSVKPELGSFAQAYECPHDYYAIKSFASLMNKMLGNKGADSKHQYIPEFHKIGESGIYEKLKKVRFYKEATFSFEEINIDNVRPISASVQTVKIRQANALINLYEKNGWRLFEPAAIRLSNNDDSLLVPPVVEVHDGELVIAEGHSRLYALMKKGHRKAYVIVVRGVSEKPAQDPINWKKVDERLEKKDIISAGLARHIETTAHIDVWADPSLDSNE